MNKPFLCFLLGASSLLAQAPPFFPDRDLVTTGVYYYPEVWPRAQWRRDITNIAKIGFEFVHMGEFAWTQLEPEEGHFDLDWLDENVKLAAANHLKIVLCTPSAAPPVWLVRQHPEVLMVDATGRRMEHGSREHACWNSPLYRAYVAKVTRRLAGRFGNNPNVIGWQIDNELGHYSKPYCYCESCQSAFRKWLHAKYETIGRLNDSWAGAFWSQRYQSFDQIVIPNPAQLPDDINPHPLLDYQRFFSDSAAEYVKFQADILGQATRGQWVTTNFVDMDPVIDPTEAGKALDVVTWTIYPAHGQLNTGPLGFRLGDGTALSFMHDLTRPINGLEGIMELQPGQVNWGAVNPQPYPGAVRMWILRSFAAGAKILCTYRYRQALFSSELYHYGIVGPDGVTLSSGGAEYRQAMKEIGGLRQRYDPKRRAPAAYAARAAGLLFRYDNRWDIDNHKQNKGWDTTSHVLKYYRALKALGAPVDVITQEKDFGKYPFLVAPAYQLVDRALVDRLRDYVEAGGHLILSCRSGQKDRQGHLWESQWAAPIRDLIGARIQFYDTLPEPWKAEVKVGERRFSWRTWGDILKPDAGTKTLATYAGQFYGGSAAAVSRKLGKGTVTYIGVDSEDGKLEHTLVRGAYLAAGVPVLDLAEGMFVDWRDGFWVATNFSSTTQKAPLAPPAKVLIGTADLKPAGVTVWLE